jgi:hypothetical protein
MNINLKNSLLTLLLLVISTMLVSAQPHPNQGSGNIGNWRLLGSVKAGHSGDHDEIVVTGPHDSYRKLKLKVTNSPLNMQKMAVIYFDGAPENIQIKDNIPEGGESRAIDLKGGKRKIRSVQFWFDTKGFLNGKAEVTLFGEK